jgi:alkyl sulfatase BDS1-like metallo-beta-lactamase superfamily hydrolase
VTVHATAAEAQAVLADAARAALNDAAFAAALKESDFSLQLALTGPQVALRIDKDEVTEGAQAATVRLEGETDALHAVLLGQLPLPRAIVEHGLAVKGKVAAVRQLGALLPVLGREYHRRLTAASA